MTFWKWGGWAAAALVVAALAGAPAGGATLAVAKPTWALSNSPNNGTSLNVLNGVSCVSATFCMAVGGYDDSSATSRTLIESWNGSTWSISKSPNGKPGYSELFGVSCVSPTFCVAAGDVSDLYGLRTFIEAWNGSTWSISKSPNNPGAYNWFFGVSCVSSTSCTAVGSHAYRQYSIQRTLIESWNGSTWSISKSPDTHYIDILQGVSCVSATSCTAVGYSDNGGIIRNLIESWNGSTWSKSPHGMLGGLYGVSCVSATSCTAVGGRIESWNGSTWSISKSPRGGLASVSCVSATSCTAAGSYAASGSSTGRTLLESWNGTAWSLSKSPNASTSTNALQGVSCVSSNFCKAVGFYYNGQNDRTLIESYG